MVSAIAPAIATMVSMPPPSQIAMRGALEEGRHWLDSFYRPSHPYSIQFGSINCAGTRPSRGSCRGLLRARRQRGHDSWLRGVRSHFCKCGLKDPGGL